MTFNPDAPPFYPINFAHPTVPLSLAKKGLHSQGSLQGRSVSKADSLLLAIDTPTPVAQKPSAKKFVAKPKVVKETVQSAISLTDQLTQYLLKITRSDKDYSDGEALDLVSKTLEKGNLPKIAKDILKKIAATPGLKQIDYLSLVSNLFAIIDKLENREIAESFADELTSLIPKLVHKPDYPQFKKCYLPLIELVLILKEKPLSNFLVATPEAMGIVDRLLPHFIEFQDEESFKKFLIDFLDLDNKKENPIGLAFTKCAVILREQEDFENLKDLLHKIEKNFSALLNESNNLPEQFIALSQKNTFLDILEALRQLNFKPKYSPEKLSFCSDIELDICLYLSEEKDHLAVKSIYETHKSETQHSNLMALLDMALEADATQTKEILTEKIIQKLIQNGLPLSAYTLWQYATWNNIWESDALKRNSISDIIKNAPGVTLTIIFSYLITSNHFKEDIPFFQSLFTAALSTPNLTRLVLKYILKQVFKMRKESSKFSDEFINSLFLKTQKFEEDPEIKSFASKLFSKIVKNNEAFSKISREQKITFLNSIKDQPLTLINHLNEINESGNIQELDEVLDDLIGFCALACLTKLNVTDLKKVFFFLIQFRNYLASSNSLVSCLDLALETKDVGLIEIISDQFTSQELRQFFSKNISIYVLRAYLKLSHAILSEAKLHSQIEKVGVSLFYVLSLFYSLPKIDYFELSQELDELRPALINKWQELPKKQLTETLGRNIYLILSDKYNDVLPDNTQELRFALHQIRDFTLGCIRSQNETLLAIARGYAIKISEKVKSILLTDVLIQLLSCPPKDIKAASAFFLSANENMGLVTRTQSDEILALAIKHLKTLQLASLKSSEISQLFQERIDYFVKKTITRVIFDNKYTDISLFVPFSKSQFLKNEYKVYMLSTALRKINSKEWSLPNPELKNIFLSIFQTIQIDSNCDYDSEALYYFGLVISIFVFCNSKSSYADLFYKNKEMRDALLTICKQTLSLLTKSQLKDLKELELTNINPGQILTAIHQFMKNIPELAEDFSQANMHMQVLQSLVLPDLNSLLPQLARSDRFATYLSELAKYTPENTLSPDKLRDIFSSLYTQLHLLNFQKDTALITRNLENFTKICMNTHPTILEGFVTWLGKQEISSSVSQIFRESVLKYS